MRRSTPARNTRTGLRVAACALTTTLAVALGGCGSNGPAATTYGPSWGSFTAAFPSTAKAATNAQMLEIGRQFPHVSAADAFYVSPTNEDIFAGGSSVPPPPTEAVLVMRFASVDDVSTIMTDLRSHLSGITRVTVNGNAGIRILGPTSSSPLAQGAKVTDPNTFLGALLLQHGDVLFEAEAVTATSASASGFLASIKPLAGS